MTTALSSKSDDLMELIDRKAREWCADKNELTLIVGVTKEGRRDIRAFRSPDAKYSPVPHEKTLYEIGSFTKVFTTSLLSVLVSQGALSLDDTVAKFFPGLELKPEIAEITVFDLATHSSGLDGSGKVLGRMVQEAVQSGDHSKYTYYQDYNKAHLHEELRIAELARPRRSGWEYSRPGLSFLGHILELAAGEDYEPLVKRHICEPLGLHDTTYTLSAEQQSRFIRGYYEDGEPSPIWYWGIMLPQGGLRSTVHDLLTFAEANLTDDGSPLSADLRRTRETEFEWPEGYALPEAPDRIPPRFNQALGWRNLTLDNGTVSEHSGGTFSYQSFGAVHQETKTGLVALTASAKNLEYLFEWSPFCREMMNEAIAVKG